MAYDVWGYLHILVYFLKEFILSDSKIYNCVCNKLLVSKIQMTPLNTCSWIELSIFYSESQISKGLDTSSTT